MSEEKKKTIQELILEEIKSGKARMRPRWYFILQTALAAVGLIFAVMVLLYLGSFIFFILDKMGIWYLPGFGLMGVAMFLNSLPWILIITGIIFLLLLELLVRHYSFGYRKPLLYSLLGIVIFVGVASLIVSSTSFHDNFRSRDMIGRLPVIGQLYRDYEKREDKGAHIGVIVEMTDQGFMMDDFRNDRLSIVVTSRTIFPTGVDFHEGDRVIILGDDDGDNDDSTITASGIQRIDADPSRHPRDQGWYRPPVLAPAPQTVPASQ